MARSPAMKQATLDDPLLDWRAEFPTVETHAPLHLALAGRHAARRRGGAAPLRRRPGSRAASARGRRAGSRCPTEVGDVLGGILDAAAGLDLDARERAPPPRRWRSRRSTSRAPRNRLVCTAEDFPSVLYLYEGLARRGAEVVRVPARDGQRASTRPTSSPRSTSAPRWWRSRTCCSAPRRCSTSAPIVRARARGGGAHADRRLPGGGHRAGGRARARACDLLAGGSVKWLCGGPGAGYLYVSPRAARRASSPRSPAGWRTSVRSTSTPGPTRRDDGARRFWTGTPGVPAFARRAPRLRDRARASACRRSARSRCARPRA